MSDSVLPWLTERASLPGTLACAARRPDGNVITHTADPTCPATTIESILANFDALAAAGAIESAAPQWSTWSFELGQIRLTERPDGWRLAVVVRNESEAAAALDSLSREFLTTQFEG
jgi:hypothetical protein